MKNEKGKKYESGGRFILHKNMIEINSAFSQSTSFCIRKEDILAYDWEGNDKLLFEYHKEMGVTEASSPDEWAKETGIDKNCKLYGIHILFSERVGEYIHTLLEDEGWTKGGYIFYYLDDDLSEFYDDLKTLDKL